MELDINTRLKGFKDIAIALEQYNLKLFSIGVSCEGSNTVKIKCSAYLTGSALEPVTLIYGRLVNVAPDTIALLYFVNRTVLEPVEFRFVSPAAAELIHYLITAIRNYRPMKLVHDAESWFLSFNFDSLHLDYIEQVKLQTRRAEPKSLNHCYRGEASITLKNSIEKIDVATLTKNAVVSSRFLARPYISKGGRRSRLY